MGFEVIQVYADTIFRLSALVLQATYGDYVNDCKARAHLKKQQLIPTYILKELPSLQVCEEKVIEEYKELVGQSRGDAIVKYMSVIEKQPTYGVHFYEIKDKTGIPYWLGLSYKGINQFDHNDRRIPRRNFQWKQLENLYFREKKFSIEVRDPKRSINLYENAIEEPIDTFDDLSTAITDPTTQVSVSRRTFGPCNVTVYVWFAATDVLTKCIWSMAIAQHQFYIDRRNLNKNCLTSPRTVEQIATELNARTISSAESSSRTNNFSTHERSLSSHSLPALGIDQTLSQLETNNTAKEKDMFETLKVRKDALEEAMNKKLQELKALCLKEGELTGELPPETPLNANEPMPQIRRRVGTAFTLNDKLLLKPRTQEEAVLSKLELEYEIQTKIVSAASKLAKDVNAKKNVRKQRKQMYQQSLAKMKDLEGRLIILRRQIAAVKLAKSRRNQSTEDLSEDNISHSTDESQEKCENSLNKFFVTERNHKQLLMKRSASLYSSVPSTPNKFSEKHGSRVRPLSPSVTSLVNRPADVMPRPRSAAAKSEPTFDYDTDEESNEMLKNLNTDFDNTSSVGSSSGGTNASVIYIGEQKSKHLLSPYVNKYETSVRLSESSNLYSVSNRRTSIAIKSQDDTQLKPPVSQFKEPLPVNKPHRHLQNDNTMSQLNRSNSLDNSHRRRTSSQGSAEGYPNPNSPSYDHHKHYHNHYPFYRATRTETPENVLPMSPSPLLTGGASHMAQRPLPTLPTNECLSPKYLPPIGSSHVNTSENRMFCETNASNSPQTVSNDVTDRSVMSYTRNHKTYQNSLFNFEEPVVMRNENSVPMSPRSVTPSKFGTNHTSSNKFQVNNNGSQPMPPPTPKTLKTWTETSLDFVLPPKTENRVTNAQTMQPNSTSKAINGRNTNSLNYENSAKELYVNVNNMASIASTPQQTPKALSSATPSPPQSLSTPTPPLASPAPIPSHMTSAMNANRNSIASITKSIGGDSVCGKPTSIPMSPTIPSGNGVEVTVVSVGHFQPYWEEEKPFELSDFYKYSQKHRNSQQSTPTPTSSQNTSPARHSQPQARSSQSVTTSGNGLQASGEPNGHHSCQSPNLNDSLKGQMIVSDSFTNELMAWYDERDSVHDDQHHNNNNNNNNNSRKHSAKQNATLV
ncbi:unnamed protein product [Medioppia subpectinata]|uniref:FERM domain-containing protein n=1 Tax=Medioppia subpectinata TaxID=1979941 RepID=A0A7R9KER1_9ACAR|nr:unnamed protein product [Medioppia subpectinata]CAG2101826.1 unnamed protein product [Medioppia subpectinata]